MVPRMTYGAPVWEGAITEHKYRQKLQSAQRLINIKIAKAYRTVSFEASCVIAAVPPIGLVIDGKVLYKFPSDRQTDRQTDRPTDRQTDRQSDRQTDSTDCRRATRRCQYTTGRPHPARRVTITETNAETTYPHGRQHGHRHGRGRSCHIPQQAVDNAMYI
jgi:hypothetical protein